MAQNNLEKNNSLDNVENVIVKVLAIGIYLSSAFFIAGLLLLFIKHEQIETSHFYFDNFQEFWNDILMLKAKPFLFAGTAILILTPISRVVLSIIQFWRYKERKFAVITLIVAFVILISVAMGIIFSLRLG
ncbi:MAG: DUF1634 domain-containing protein [Bacteroidota bacterium]